MSAGGESARADLWGGVGWAVFGLTLVVLSLKMDRFEAMGANLYAAPGLVPGAFGVLLVALGAILALRGWRRGRAHAASAAGPLLNARTVLMLVLCLAYAAGLVGRVPFLPASAAFVAAFTWAYSEAPRAWRQLGVALLSGVATAVIVVLVFERVFLVRLP